MQETYTIMQRTNFDSWATIDVVHDLKEACNLAAHYCDAAGVERTIVLDEMGSMVCVES